MSLNGFNITYDIVTQESAENGDYEESGFLAKGLTFREAIETFNSERDWSMVEADCYPVTNPRWFTDYGEADYRTGETRSVSLHLPEYITESSRQRIARLINCYGVKKKA